MCLVHCPIPYSAVLQHVRVPLSCLTSREHDYSIVITCMFNGHLNITCTHIVLIGIFFEKQSLCWLEKLKGRNDLCCPAIVINRLKITKLVLIYKLQLQYSLVY